jgi:hypothetical protein
MCEEVTRSPFRKFQKLREQLEQLVVAYEADYRGVFELAFEPATIDPG